MEAIVKVISVFIGLFVFANGIWVAWQPPLGDEPIGYTIMAVGIAIPVITLYFAQMTEKSYD